MNTKFNSTPLNPSGRFPSASFCVFSNRFVAIIVSSCVCWYYHGSGSLTGTVPLLSFTPCALSNTISSWCQYKALEYVSFSLQTLFKSTKVCSIKAFVCNDIGLYFFRFSGYSSYAYGYSIEEQ